MAHADVFASAKMVKKSDIQGGKYLKKKKFSKFLKKIEQCMKYDRMLEENKRGIVKTLPPKNVLFCTDSERESPFLL